MATTTAFGVIGQKHPYHGGVTPTHLLFLTENDRPAITMFKIRRDALERLATWIPTVEHMIEDLALMTGTLCGVHSALADVVRQQFGADLRRVEMYSVAEQDRDDLYDLSRKTALDGKIVLTVLEDSTLLRQAVRICEYPIDCELCISSRAAHPENLLKEENANA